MTGSDVTLKFFKVTREISVVTSLIVLAEDEDSAEEIAAKVDHDDWNRESYDTSTYEARDYSPHRNEEFWLADQDEVTWENYQSDVDYSTYERDDTDSDYSLYGSNGPGDVPFIGLSDDAEALASAYGPDEY